MNIDLTGKIALVTGATGQLGRVMIRTLAECGADMVIHYHKNSKKAEELHKEIVSSGRRALIVQADITDFDSVMHMRDAVVKELGAPDIVVNNAVIQYNWTTVLEQPIEDYESQFRSCVVHNVLMAKAFIPCMIEKGTEDLSGSTQNAPCRISPPNPPMLQVKGVWTEYTESWPKKWEGIRSR